MYVRFSGLWLIETDHTDLKLGPRLYPGRCG